MVVHSAPGLPPLLLDRAPSRSFTWTYYLPSGVTLSVVPSAVLANTAQTVSIDSFVYDIPRNASLSFKNSHGASLHFTLFVRRDEFGAVKLHSEVLLAVPGTYIASVVTGGTMVQTRETSFRVLSQATLMMTGATSGPVQGGTLVTMQFQPDSTLHDQELACSFGDNLVDVSFLNASVLSCTSPAATRPRAVEFSVIYRAEQLEVARGAFQYLPDDVVTAVSPRSLSSSMRDVSLTVTDYNFYASIEATPLCRIGDDITAGATILSSTSAVCVVPIGMALNPGAHVVSLACDGTNYAASTAYITVVAAPQLLSLNPSVVPVSGVAIVKVNGAGFPSEQAVKCAYSDGQYVTNGTTLSSEVAECETPEDVGRLTELVPLSLDMEGVATNSLILKFVAPLVVTGISPTSGFSRGGSIVQVIARNAPRHGALYCEFG